MSAATRRNTRKYARLTLAGDESYDDAPSLPRAARHNAASSEYVQNRTARGPIPKIVTDRKVNIGIFYDGYNFSLFQRAFHSLKHDASWLDHKCFTAFAVRTVCNFIRDKYNIYVKSDDCEISEEHLYIGTPDGSFSPRDNPEFYFGIKTHTRTLKKMSDGRLHEKGVDTQLSMDIFRISSEKNLSAIILLSNDSDFVPIFESLRERGILAISYVFKNGSNNFSPEMERAADLLVEMSSNVEEMTKDQRTDEYYPEELLQIEAEKNEKLERLNNDLIRKIEELENRCNTLSSESNSLKATIYGLRSKDQTLSAHETTSLPKLDAEGRGAGSSYMRRAELHPSDERQKISKPAPLQQCDWNWERDMQLFIQPNNSRYRMRAIQKNCGERDK